MERQKIVRERKGETKVKNKIILLIILPLLLFSVSEVNAGERYAKMELALIEALEAKGPEESERIAIWLIPSRDPSDIMRQMREPGGKMREGELLDEARVLMTETQAPTIEFLRARGFEPLYSSEYAPLIFAEPSKATIFELARRPDVEMIYLSREYKELINHGAKSERADVVWARGITGGGVQIAVVEYGKIDFTNDHLATGTTRLPGLAPRPHTTAVAGVIVSYKNSPHDRYKGVAHGAPGLLSADAGGWTDAQVVAATDWAINNGARIINKSYGTDTDLGLVAMDRYCDYVVRNYYKTIVVAAGNEAGGSGTGTDNVTSPGLAYNVITVGNYDDQENFIWKDDIMRASSSWRDPRGVITNVLFNGNSTGLTATVLTDNGANFGAVNSLVGKYLNPNTNQQTSFLITANTATTITVSNMEGWYGLTDWAAVGDPYQVQEETSGDREKPEVTAMGTNIHTTVVGGGIGLYGSGTSFAAPAVTSEAALIIERDNSLGGSLYIWPEAIKAIIMASSCHDIEKGTMEKDGAGGIVACEADEIVQNRQFHHQFLTPSDFTGGYWIKNIELMADREARVVICWDSNPVRNAITGTSTGLTATTLTDNTADFGANNSKVGWILNPNITQDNLYFSVVSNTNQTLTVTPGSDMTAVAAVGDNYSLVSYPTDNLDADLDLWIWDPVLGNWVGWSYSQYNNYEIADFVPSRTGTYEVKVYNARFDGTIEPFGLAWTQEPCCSPDWGDAPDEMLHCPTRPERGDFPTLESSNGANVREFEVEWLSQDNTTSPGATWEMDAYVDPFQAEKDQDSVSNVDPPLCVPDQDLEDDGVLPDPIYIAGTRGRVTFWVSSATPDIGRYSNEQFDEKIYVSGWFDWEHDDFTWIGNMMVHWIGGPGMVGVMDVGDCIEGCDMWDRTQHQKRVTAEFDVPPFLPTGPFWIRFRLDYGEDISVELDTATYGEIEDHISYQTTWHWKDPYEDYAPSGMPDFSQLQDNWNNPITLQPTFCGPVAIANCFWWFDSRYNEQLPGVPGDAVDMFPLVRDYLDDLPPYTVFQDDHDMWNVDHGITGWPPDVEAPPATSQPFIPGEQMPGGGLPYWGELVERLAWYLDTDGIRTGDATIVGTNIMSMQEGIDMWLSSEMFEDSSTLADTLCVVTTPMPTFEYVESLVEKCEDVILLLGFWFEEGGAEQQFIRGDVNGDGMAVSIEDLTACLHGPPYLCDDAADVNDDGILDTTDCEYLSNYFIYGEPLPPTPFPNCGLDPTMDGLGCASFPPCPGGGGQWWRVGGHYVTVAGVNSEEFQIAFSDPFIDWAEFGNPGRVGSGHYIEHVYPHASPIVHNDAGNVSHDIYTVMDPSPSPGGLWSLYDYPATIEPYGWMEPFQGQNVPDEFLDQTAPWNEISPIYTEVEYCVHISPWGYRGDCNGDGVVDIGDVVYEINYLFRNGPPPEPMSAGDVNCDGTEDIGDVVFKLNYLFRNGPIPRCCDP